MTNVCDTCLTAAYDYTLAPSDPSPSLQASICRILGADIEDHCCEETEYGTRCACACHEKGAL